MPALQDHGILVVPHAKDPELTKNKTSLSVWYIGVINTGPERARHILGG